MNPYHPMLREEEIVTARKALRIVSRAIEVARRRGMEDVSVQLFPVYRYLFFRAHDASPTENHAGSEIENDGGTIE